MEIIFTKEEVSGMMRKMKDDCASFIGVTIELDPDEFGNLWVNSAHISTYDEKEKE